jgi:uncharacterized protein with PIN domain
MQFRDETSKLPVLSRFSTVRTARCPYCGDRLVAPEVSEFITGGEVRHHWACDCCGQDSSTRVAVLTH